MPDVGAEDLIRILEELLEGRRTRAQVSRWARERWSSSYVEPAVPVAPECRWVFEHLWAIEEPGLPGRGETYVLRDSDIAHDLDRVRRGGVAPAGAFEPREIARTPVPVAEIARRAGRPTRRHLVRGVGWREVLVLRRADGTGGFGFEQDYAREEETRVHAASEEGADDQALRSVFALGILGDDEVTSSGVGSGP